MTNGRSVDRWHVLRHDNAVLALLALVGLAVHLATNLCGGYGYFRDEFYYLACSDHLAWGYVDEPPFSIAVLWLDRSLFGDSLFALRLPPAIAGAAAVFLSGLLARRLGGKRFAQAMTACATIAAPLLLATYSVFSMNAFDVFFWTLAFYLVALIVLDDKQKYWIFLGFVLGLGLLNKISVLWLGTGLVAGLLLTSQRSLLRRRTPWLAAGIAGLLFLPHVVWQAAHDFPTLEFIRNASTEKYTPASPLKIFSEQVLNMNPSTLLIWLPGLVYFLVAKHLKPFRIFPIVYLVVFFILVANGSSKSSYLGPLFPMLFALGAVTFETFARTHDWRWLKPVVFASVLLSGIASAPFAIAVLPVERYIAYAQALGMAPSTSERKELARLPQFYADMFGWEEMVATVARAHDTLSTAEKAQCAILTNNYGEAGAIDFFGPKYGLPRAISGHNNYWLWGPRGATGEVVIRLDGSRKELQESYRDVILAGEFHDDYCMPYENDMPIWILKGRRTPIKDDWSEFKHYE